MDPFGNMQNMLMQYRQFMQNPTQFLMQRKLDIPQEYMNNPQEAIQHLMNTGKLSQQQYNWASNMSKRILQNLPK